jgi:glycine/D-amino acid oxidase-like deaminating enzyme
MGRDLAEIPLALESQRLWSELDALAGAETGFRRAGALWLCDDEKQLAAYEAWLDAAKQYQISSRLLSATELEEMLPGGRRRFAGALSTPSDCRAEPQKATPAIAAAARRLGAHVLENCAVRGLERQSGRVSGVVTEKGRVACEAVIVAGGAWSRLLLGNEGVDLPQLKILDSVLATAPLAGPEVAVGASNFAFRKRLDGGYSVARRNGSISHITPDSFRLLFDFLPQLAKSWRELRLRVGRRFIEEWRMPRRWALDTVTPFEEVRTLDPEPDHAQLDEVTRILPAAFPAFEGFKTAHRWAGLIDVTPDAVPVISTVEGVPGLVVATGFSGHGFGVGPGGGKLAGDLVTGATPLVDPRPFRLDRFKRAAGAA